MIHRARAGRIALLAVAVAGFATDLGRVVLRLSRDGLDLVAFGTQTDAQKF